MEQVTIIKPYRKTETLRLTELTDVLNLIRNGEYHDVVGQLRSAYPLLDLERKADGQMSGASLFLDKLPRVCFASEIENRNKQRVTLGYTGLVLLEVNNLTGYDEASAIRRGAGEMPQTVMAFVGASGRSVKIVCRGELFPSEKSDGMKVPFEEGAVELFHENLYERARLAYNAQLGVTIEKLDPRLDRTCYMSYDDAAVFNPMAVPFYARAEKPSRSLSLVKPTTVEATEVSPGESRYFSMSHIFEFNLDKAFDECESERDSKDYQHLLLIRLAVHCLETGIPMAIAKRLTRWRSFFVGDDELLIDKVFANVYRPSLVKRYVERNGYKPEKNIPAEALMTMKIDIFLNEEYEIRKNVMRGVAEFRERTGVGFSFRDLTEEARNSITLRAMSQGIKCWDKDIRRYMNSENVELFNPLTEYLENLPRWDGKDRVQALARRVPTDYEEWPVLFHLWMRSMVAMWLGKGQLTGNALVPLLIGRQGCGKSSFCRILLPVDLREYYNDRINFKNETDLYLGLTSFGLINLDEFDKITQRQQIVLKYLVSTADLKYRTPYGKAYSEHCRYASFIGTTNEMKPLTDPSGARRFVCVYVNGDIDFRESVEYNQLYAQLCQEIRNGERYWPTREQELALITRNMTYQQVSGLSEMLLSVLQRPEPDEEGQWMSIREIAVLLKSNFKDFKVDSSSFRKIGFSLSNLENRFKSKHSNIGTQYWVKVRDAKKS